MSDPFAPTREAQRRWARLDARRRASIVGSVRHELADHADAFAAAIPAPYRTHSERLISEVLPLADGAKFLQRQAAHVLKTRRLGPRGRPLWLAGTRARVERVPLGVVLVVGPSNYPLLLPGSHALQALAAGNAAVVKPAPGCEAPVRLLRDACQRAGLPPELFVVLEGDASAVRSAIAAGVDKVVLTGSARTGAAVLADLAPHAIPATMELSGNDAAYVIDGADLPLVARSVAWGMALNGGATCIAPRRLYARPGDVHALAGLLADELKAKPPAAVPDVVLRRLSTAAGDAVSRGATLVAGELPLAGAMRPLVLRDVPDDSDLLREEWFAPVLCLIPTRDPADAARRGSTCPYALGASVFGSPDAAAALAGQLDVGAVTVNDVIVPTADPRLPFGGRGRSGFGVTRGAEGLLEMTRAKVVVVRRGRLRPHLDPPRPDDAALFAEYLRAAHGRTLGGRLASVARLVRTLVRRGRPAAATPTIPHEQIQTRPASATATPGVTP